MREEHRVGLDYLEAVTALRQRSRKAHPTDGLFEAAEFHWWWSKPRSTDDLPQLFWFDDDGEPEAAVIITAWGSGSSAVYADATITPLFMPDPTPEQVAHVIDRGIEHAKGAGIDVIELEVSRTDEVMQQVLLTHGITIKEDALIEAWMNADDRADISELHDGYRLASRSEMTHEPHHMIKRSGPAVAERLLQTSLYRDDLDLVVYAPNGDIAAYGMFWFDPESLTGVVEPMRTEDAHQQRGLARHVLTSGIDRLAKAGAQRVSIGYEPGNPASGHLYRSVGFEPHAQTDLFSSAPG